MKKLFLLFFFLPLMAWAGDEYSPSTGTVVVSRRESSIVKTERVVLLDWTSNTSGTTTGTLKAIHGHVSRVTFDPSTPAPTDNYDVTITDQEGQDILDGKGANRHTTTTQTITPFTSDGTNKAPGMQVNGDLILSITNAGASKKGRIAIYLEW